MLKTAEPTEEALNTGANVDAVKKLLGLLGVSFATGAGVRGLTGSRYLFGRPAYEPRQDLGPDVLHVYYPVKKKPGVPLPKVALDLSDPKVFLPAAAVAAPTALFGGYHLMDWFLNRKRRNDLQKEIDDARTHYRQALLQEFQKPGAKTAADSLDADLDRLYDFVNSSFIKQAFGITDNVVGGALAAAALTALGSGYLTYKYTKDRSSAKLLENAIRMRERQRWARRPTDLQAVPVPVHMGRIGITPDRSFNEAEDAIP